MDRSATNKYENMGYERHGQFRAINSENVFMILWQKSGTKEKNAR